MKRSWGDVWWPLSTTKTMSNLNDVTVYAVKLTTAIRYNYVSHKKDYFGSYIKKIIIRMHNRSSELEIMVVKKFCWLNF